MFPTLVTWTTHFIDAGTLQFSPSTQGRIQGGPGGPDPPLTTKNEAPAPKFYKTEAPEWQF